jgi:uncharacterized protein YaiE (UPF0345 family)
MIKVNEYQDGRVKSLGFESSGQTYTVGVVEPGSYRFPTEKEEHLTVMVGSLTVQWPGKDRSEYAPGETFVIPPGVEFELETDVTSTYLCVYK